MKARITVASVVASLVLAVTVVSIAASPAFAASCGNGQGQALLIGCDNNTAVDDTRLSSPATNGAVLFLTATGSGTTTGLSSSGTTGVKGTSGVSFGEGVFGDNVGTGNGVRGHTNSGFASGVYGQNDGAGYGVAGRASSGTGVFGDSQNGVGVYANSGLGTALQVAGRSKFSTAGTAVVTSGQKSVTVHFLGVTATDFVLATVQGASGPFVKTVMTGSGQFTIYLNKVAPPAGVKVAYFVISA